MFWRPQKTTPDCSTLHPNPVTRQLQTGGWQWCEFVSLETSMIRVMKTAFYASLCKETVARLDFDWPATLHDTAWYCMVKRRIYMMAKSDLLMRSPLGSSCPPFLCALRTWSSNGTSHSDIVKSLMRFWGTQTPSVVKQWRIILPPIHLHLSQTNIPSSPGMTHTAYNLQGWAVLNKGTFSQAIWEKTCVIMDLFLCVSWSAAKDCGCVMGLSMARKRLLWLKFLNLSSLLYQETQVILGSVFNLSQDKSLFGKAVTSRNGRPSIFSFLPVSTCNLSWMAIVSLKMSPHQLVCI